MKRNPIYVFRDRSSNGIVNIPLESIIQVIDADGLGTPMVTQIIDKSNLNTSSTIGDFLDIPTSHITLDRDTLSELEKIGNGWRLLGKPAANYAIVGNNAVDLSNSENVGEYGAKGEASFAVGTGTKAQNRDSVAMGTCNVGTSGETILEIGNGVTAAPKNVFEVYDNGTITAPDVTDAKITSRGAKTLTTQEYVENRVATEFPSKTTDDLLEGINNLYYTDLRDTTNFNVNLAAANIDALADVDTATIVPTTGQVLKFDGVKWIPGTDLHEVTSVNTKTGDVVLSTDDVNEGINVDRKYYTAARFDTAFGAKTTDDLTEGANLYYTASRAEGSADTRIAASPISTLANVSTNPASVGHVLKYNGTHWQPELDNDGITEINGDTGVGGVVTMNIGDMADVNATGTTVGQILAYDNIAAEWASVTPTDTVTLVENNLTSSSTVNALSANQGNLLDLNKEGVLGNPASDGDVLVSTMAGVRSWSTLASSTTVIDDLTSTSGTDALSANMGRQLEAAKANLAAPSFSGLVDVVDLAASGNASVTGSLGVTGNVTALADVAVTGTLSAQIATGAVPGLMSGTDFTKLAGVEAGAQVNVAVTKADVDALGVNAATISNLTVATAVPAGALFTDTDTVYDDTTIQAEVDLNTAHTALVAGNPHAVTATDVGLGSVDDTADVDKPVSTVTQTALNGKLDAGGASGSFTNTPGTAFTITYADGLITSIA